MYIEHPQAVLDAFGQGAVIAYPTEAVFGLGCDPDNIQAMQTLLALKQRPKEKGVILIAGDFAQVARYVDENAIPAEMRETIFASWPGPNTWLLPKSEHASDWLTGGSDLIAVRVTEHPLVRELTALLGKPLVSTSANLSGQPPAVNAEEIRAQFADKVFLLDGPLGGAENPSTIRNGLNGDVLRAG